MPIAENDLAIIKLSTCINFSDQMKAIEVSTDYDVDGTGELVVAVTVGWTHRLKTSKTNFKQQK